MFQVGIIGRVVMVNQLLFIRYAVTVAVPVAVQVIGIRLADDQPVLHRQHHTW